MRQIREQRIFRTFISTLDKVSKALATSSGEKHKRDDNKVNSRIFMSLRAILGTDKDLLYVEENKEANKSATCGPNAVRLLKLTWSGMVEMVRSLFMNDLFIDES